MMHIGHITRKKFIEDLIRFGGEGDSFSIIAFQLTHVYLSLGTGISCTVK